MLNSIVCRDFIYMSVAVNGTVVIEKVWFIDQLKSLGR